MFCDVRVFYRLMVVVVKATRTDNMHNILLESLLSDVFYVLERFGIMMDTQAIGVVTFDIKGTRSCSWSCERLYWLPNEFRLGA